MPRSDITGPIPVYLSYADSDPFQDLIGTAEITEFGTLVITVSPGELTQRVPQLAELNQIVGLNVGIQYRLDAPTIKENPNAS